MTSACGWITWPTTSSAALRRAPGTSSQGTGKASHSGRPEPRGTWSRGTTSEPMQPGTRPSPTTTGSRSTARETPSAAPRQGQETSSPGTPSTGSTSMGSMPPETLSRGISSGPMPPERRLWGTASMVSQSYSHPRTPIGGTAPGAGNVLSGNGFAGVFLLGDRHRQTT